MNRLVSEGHLNHKVAGSSSTWHLAALGPNIDTIVITPGDLWVKIVTRKLVIEAFSDICSKLVQGQPNA